MPLLAELPVLTAHARAAWPWARATVATAAAAAFSRRPFAFTPPLALCRTRRQQRQHAATPRNRIRRRCSGSRRIDREYHAHPSRPMVGVTCSSALGDGGCSGDYSGVGDKGDRCSEDQTPRYPISSSRTAPSPPSSPFLSSSQNGDRAPPLTRLGAVQETLASAARWVAGAAGGSALTGVGPAVVYADGVGGEREDEGGGGEGGERFGSKAFTRKSYDGFADGYDDLDGGWAASAIGTEVRQTAHARRIVLLSRALPWRIGFGCCCGFMAERSRATTRRAGCACRSVADTAVPPALP